MMVLIKNTIETLPIMNRSFLLLLKIKDKTDYVWSLGELTKTGWILYDNRFNDFEVLEWYDLPDRPEHIEEPD